ncbi:MAG: imidazolonepropionase [Candidatus Obscuribacterales bacterium]|nr:imidazolonepropionase [Candidatus Obscuribacterales bacterium]
MTRNPGNSAQASEGSQKSLSRDSRIPVDLLISPIAELVTAESHDGPVRGEEMRDIRRIKDAAIAISGGQIIAVGSADEIKHAVVTDSNTEIIDARENLVSPGLVDAHTHLIFDGNRADEFVMRSQGKTYTEIAAAGGGIVKSMRATQNADVERLISLGRKRVERMLESGTTALEVKTGYGLEAESELRMLEAIYRLKSESALDIVPTFMAAHAIPPGKEREGYVDDIVNDMLPRVVAMAQDQADREGVHVTHMLPYVDVFCDRGYFTLEDTRKIFQAAIALGLKPRVHSDEFVNLGATTLAVELGAASADHLLNVSDEEISLLAKSSTVAVLLPGTSFYLNLSEHAPARKMIEEGVAIALATDYNPGSCHISSLPFVWGLACLHLKMLPEEALTALTVNGAWAIGLGRNIGQLRPGYQADVTIYDVKQLEEVPYNIGWNPVKQVVKKGRTVYSR